jgi:hypothetical protein
MFLVNLLLWYDFLLESWNRKKEEWKEWVRYMLGPSPFQNYILLANDDVIPTSQSHTHENALVYSSSDKTIKPLNTTSKTLKLPWLSLECKVGEKVHEYSDWLSEIKVQAIPSLLSIVRLAALVHNSYIPEEQCKVHVIGRDGEEEVYMFRGRRQLIKELPLPLKHRDTLPYDKSEKIDSKDGSDCLWFFYQTS